MKLITYNHKNSSFTTENTKEILESVYNKKGWKRVMKFTEYVRLFTDGSKLYLISDEEILEDCEDIIINEIKQIKNVIKNYYSFDYGEVYYNPKEKKLFINVGDGGYFYSKTKINIKNLDDDKIDNILIKMENDVANNIEVQKIDLPFIKKVTFEAECAPISCGLVGYFHIGNLNII